MPCHPVLVPPKLGRTSMQPFIDALDFFAVATLTWYFADRLERANYGLSRWWSTWLPAAILSN
jgi:hypothetical protein